MYSLALAPGAAEREHGQIGGGHPVTTSAHCARSSGAAPVALLAPLLPQAVERREHVVEADRLAPRDRPARVVQAELSPASTSSGEPRPRRPRTRPRSRAGRRSGPSTRPGASPTHSVWKPRLREEALGRLGVRAWVLGSRVSSTSRALSSGGSRWKPTAPGSPRAARLRRAHSTSRRRPAERAGSRGAGPRRRSARPAPALAAASIAGRRARARAAPSASAPPPSMATRAPSPPPGSSGSGSSGRWTPSSP